jgi:transcription elongation GreA/GreB family factor
MSRAFIKEMEDAVEELPDRPISTHRNLVTPEGLAAIEAELARLREELETARAADDRDAIARVSRDLRYWNARHATAQVQDPPKDNEEVRFGSSVAIVSEDGARREFRIVGEDQADPAHGTISYVSPMAQALLGMGVGDVVRVANAEVEIVSIA